MYISYQINYFFVCWMVRFILLALRFGAGVGCSSYTLVQDRLIGNYVQQYISYVASRGVRKQDPRNIYHVNTHYFLIKELLIIWNKNWCSSPLLCVSFSLNPSCLLRFTLLFAIYTFFFLSTNLLDFTSFVIYPSHFESWHYSYLMKIYSPFIRKKI